MTDTETDCWHLSKSRNVLLWHDDEEEEEEKEEQEKEEVEDEVAARWQNATLQRCGEMRRAVNGEVCLLKTSEAPCCIMLSLRGSYSKIVLDVDSC